MEEITEDAEVVARVAALDMSRFPAAGHLVSWAKYAARARQPAGKAKPGTSGKGNPWIASTLGEAGIGAARTKTFLDSHYHRLAHRRGKQRALVAVANPSSPSPGTCRPTRRPVHRPRPRLA